MLVESNKNQNFKTRLRESSFWTESWMKYLTHSGHIKEYKKALKEDDLKGVDYWVKYLEKWVPIQFKLRVEVGQRDCPVVFYQPFYGVDVQFSHESNVGLNKFGRDYCGLMNGVSDFYYVAVKNNAGLYQQVYRFKSSTLKDIVIRLEKEWKNVEKYETLDGYEVTNSRFALRHDNMTSVKLSSMKNKMTPLFSNDQAEVWLQKNEKETFYKINFYVNELLKEDVYNIPAHIAEGVRGLFFKAKNA